MERILDVSAQALLDELVVIGTESDLQPGEITVKDFSEKLSISKEAARKRLEILCQNETLVKRMCKHNGYSINAYRRADD